MLNRMLAQLANTITGIATQSVVDAVRVLACQIVAVVVGLTIGLTGLGFLCGSAYMALAQQYGGPQAAAGVAIGLLLLCGACIGAAFLIGRKRTAPEPEPVVVKVAPPSPVAVNPLLADPAIATLVDTLARPGRGTFKGDLGFLAVAIGTGFAVGVSPQLRRSLLLGLSSVLAARTREE